MVILGDIWILSSSLTFPPNGSFLVKVHSNFATTSVKVIVRPLSGNMQTIGEGK